MTARTIFANSLLAVGFAIAIAAIPLSEFLSVDPEWRLVVALVLISFAHTLGLLRDMVMKAKIRFSSFKSVLTLGLFIIAFMSSPLIHGDHGLIKEISTSRR